MWEVLNFAVIAAVCIICCPSDNSRMLSYASQLPTEDPDDEGMGGRGTGLDDDDDDDEFEYEYGAGASSSPTSGSKARGEGEGEGGSAGEDGEGGVELSNWKGRIANTMSSIGSTLAGAAGGGSPRGGAAGFAALPSAEDEEFGLQGEEN